jgi:ubiquinone biosynthesis protein
MVSILNAVRDLDRLRQIYVVLVRHGFGELAQRLGFGRGKRPKALLTAAGADAGSLDEGEADDIVPEAEARRGEDERRRISPPERMRLVAMDLGPSFVKLGQLASTRPDVIPQPYILELKKLQDEVTPLSFARMKDAVEASLGRTIDEAYARFDERPLAAASIGQVHRATLRDPDEAHDVVVKVQRPGIRSTVARDLELLHALAALLERTIPEAHVYAPSALVDQFDRAITAELDFALEAEHAQKFARNFEGYPGVRFPKVYKQASTKQVLTLEFLPGKKVYDAIREDGHSGPVIAKAAIGIVVKMIFEDGFFHADPHPGNILISGTRDAPVIGLVDLGMVGRLSPEMRDRAIDLMVGAARHDYVAIADALYQIGTPTRKVDLRAYRAEVAELAEKYLGRSLKEIDPAEMIGDLARGAARYGIEIAPDFLLVGKALMTIEGVGKEIDPDLDVFGEARPLFLALLRKRYSPERVGNDLFRGLERLSGAAVDMPQQLREILDDLRLGRLTVKASDPALPAVVDRLGRRLFTGLVVSACVIAGAWITAASQGKQLGIALFAAAAALTLIHVLADAIRRRHR